MVQPRKWLYEILGEDPVLILVDELVEYTVFYPLQNSEALLAISEVQNDRGLLESLTKESQNELKKKLNDAEKEIPFRILNAYRHLALLEEKEWIWKAKKESEEGREEMVGEEGEETRKYGTVTKLALRAKIPWDKLSSIVNGVIRPLKEKGLPPEITIEIKAESQEGFDRTTLDSKVKETLQQIGAEIEEWKEE